MCPPDDPSFADDLVGVVQCGEDLGITSDGMAEYLAECCNRALALFRTVDDGVAWDRVTTALLRKGELSGEAVERIVGQFPSYSSGRAG